MKWTYLLLFLFIGCNSETPKLSSISGINSSTNVTGNLNAKVSGLGTTQVKVSINGESEILAPQDGDYAFPKGLAENSEYHAKITQQPTDGIKCDIVNPMGEYSGGRLTIEVRCDSSTKMFVNGLISGNFTGPLKLKVDSDVIEVPEGAQSFFFPNAVLSNSFGGVQIVSPTNQCLFANGQANSGISQTNGRFDIWCNTIADGANYNIRVTITDLGQGETINLGTNFAGSFSLTNVSQKTLLSAAKNDKRYILEILEAPYSKRCYIVNSLNKDHFYAFSPPKYDVNITIKCSTRASCEALSTELPAVNGKLNDIACAKDYTYYGGSFTNIGRQYGIVPLSITATSLDFSSKVFDRIHGKVNKIISDGRSGYFVAGHFQKVGDENRSNLAHLNSDFTVDLNFRTGTDGEIKDLIFKDNELFLFGSFTKVFRESENYERRAFAKILLTTAPEKVSVLNLPGLPPFSKASASLIDWNLYFHVEVGGIAGAPNTYSYIVNKNTGATKVAKTSSVENGNTLYWKEATSGKVWMINTGLGLIDPETLSHHPQEITAESIVRKNRLYTLVESSSRLYQASSTTIEVTDLLNLSSSSTNNFGRLGTTPKNILSAGVGFPINDGLLTCFLQRAGTPGIQYDADTTIKKGIACFDSNGSMASYTLASNLPATSGFSQSGKIVLNSQFYEFNEINAMAIIDNFGHVTIKDAHIPSGYSVLALESDGNNVYLGGDFPYIIPCTACKRLAKSGPADVSIIDSSWLSTPFNSGAVTKLAYSAQNLFVATTFNNNSLYAFNVINTAQKSQVSRGSLTTDLKALNSTMMLTENDRHFFLKLNYASGTFDEPSSSVQAYGPLAVYSSHFLAPGLISTLRFFNDQGGNESDLPIPEYRPETLKLTSVGTNICTYDGKIGVSCFNEFLQGTLDGSPNIVDVNFNVFKGISNYVILAKEYSAPVVLVPKSGP